MLNLHPKLIEDLVNQTNKVMSAMMGLSSIYLWIFSEFIPLNLLFSWFFVQILTAVYRFYNAKMFIKNLQQKNEVKINNNQVYFIISVIFQSFMWFLSSLLVIFYAPQPYELISFVIASVVITGATLSMSPFYKAYLIFLFSMIVPQIGIMLYYGEPHHIDLVIISFIAIPSLMILSKVIYTSRLGIITAHNELEESVAKLYQLSIKDNLTNIYNRRYFFEMSEKFISIARREQQKVALIMLDIDHFKRINDTYGHQAGDFILINLAKKIENTLRAGDIFARIGGEEFSLLLNDTSLEGASIIAEKIRTQVERKTFIYNATPIKITISMGISELNKQNTSLEAMYKESDSKLYTAKNNGRNRVEL